MAKAPRTQPIRCAAHLLGGLALLLLIVFGNIPSEAEWAPVVANAAHGPVSAILSMIVMSGLRDWSTNPSLRSRAVGSVIGVILLGILVELVQGAIGHDAELRDVLTDAIGALAGACFYSAVALRHSQRRDGFRRALASAVLFSVILAAPVLIMLAAYVATDLRSPVLVDANQPLGMYFMGAHWITPRVEPLPERWQASTGKHAGYHVMLDNKEHWGLSLRQFHSDWRAWQWLSIEIVNPTDSVLQLNLRVFDRDDGLSNRIGWKAPLTIRPQSQLSTRLNIPAMHASGGDHAIDIKNVQGLVIAAEPNNVAQEFYVLKISLQ